MWLLYLLFYCIRVGSCETKPKYSIEIVKECKAGFANQVLFFQYSLLKMLKEYSSTTLIINGPRSSHIHNCYANHTFYEFFTLNSLEKCIELTSNNGRNHICNEFIPILSKAIDSQSNLSQNDTVKLDFPREYCMPWPHKSVSVGQKHCPKKSIPELPFFFELYHFHDFIELLSQKFMQDHGLTPKSFTGVHYRGGDFKGKNFFKKCFFTVDEVLQYSFAVIKKYDSPKKLFIMAETESDVPKEPKYITGVSSAWLHTALEENNLDAYKNSLNFIKLLLELSIASKAKILIGNEVSTLTQILFSYAKLLDVDTILEFVPRNHN